MPYDKQQARELLERVLEKLERSSDQYKDAYVLNDITRELGEELDDLVGWTLLETLRIRETLLAQVYKADNIYWEKFLKHQTPAFLEQLVVRAAEELMRRSEEGFSGGVTFVPNSQSQQRLWHLRLDRMRPNQEEFSDDPPLFITPLLPRSE